MAQPEIEILATDKFGIIQTGKRLIPTLSVAMRGSPLPTLKSNYSLSDLFGEAATVTTPGYIYMDAAGTELQFTGSSNTVSSFTMGTYVYGPKTCETVWSQMVPHGYNGQTDDWQFMRMYFPYIGCSTYRTIIGYTNTAATGGSLATMGLNVSAEKASGWYHVAYSFDSNTGLLKGFVNGEFIYLENKAGWTANGASGAYDKNLNF